MSEGTRYLWVGGQKVPVEESLYFDIRRPIWRSQYYARKYGECGGSKEDRRRCDGVCEGCKHQRLGTKKLYIDAPLHGDYDGLTLDETIQNPAPSLEDVLIEKDLHKALSLELSKLDSDSLQICVLVAQGLSERQIANELGIPQTTLSYRKRKIFAKLAESLRDFI